MKNLIGSTTGISATKKRNNIMATSSKGNPEAVIPLFSKQLPSPLRNHHTMRAKAFFQAPILDCRWKKRKASPSHSMPNLNETYLPRSSKKINKYYAISFTFVVFLSMITTTFLMIALVQYTMLTSKTESITIPTYPNIVVSLSSFHAASATRKRSTRTFPPRVVLSDDTMGGYNHGSFHPLKSSSSLFDSLLTYSNTSDNQIYRVPYTLGNCTPIAPWQVETKPNCNSMHEIDVPNFVISNSKIRSTLEEGSIAFLGQGWFRMAWKLHTGLATAIPKQKPQDDYYELYQDYIESHFYNALSPPIILKTLRFERDFLDEYYDLHRRDAMAMERLTFSPFVLDVYGYCGQSALNEIAVDNVEKVFKIGNDYDLNTEFKLLTCLAIALAVAHVHTLDKPLPATLVHYDLNPRNVAIMADGTPKLNDFNVAEFLRWDNTTKQPCGFTGRFYEPWWRAPEELKTSDEEKAMRNHLLYDPNATTLVEKVDVYSLGNVMYRILTGRAPRGKSIPERVLEVRDDVVNGYLPPLESVYIKSKDPNVIAILDAMLMCYQPDPNLRSTAKEVASFLAESVKGIKGFRSGKRFLRKYKKFIEP